jgi:hypothetical protein
VLSRTGPLPFVPDGPAPAALRHTIGHICYSSPIVSLFPLVQDP